MDLAFSPNAAKAIDERLGPVGRAAWIGAVPARLAALEQAWGVRVTENLHAGTSGLVFRARTDEIPGGDLALKLSFKETELEAEHHALRAAEKLDIRPLAREYRYEHGAISTFWIFGTPAAAGLSPDDLRDTLDEIHVEAPSDAAFRPLGSFVDAALDRAFARLPGAAGCGIDASHLARARELATSLDAAGHRSYLHGDVHPTNVLSTATGLMLCDPKGLVGDPAYDAANWSLKADKLMSRRAWIDFFGPHYGPSRVAGWAAILAATNAVSFAAQGKRADRMHAYAELALELLGAAVP